MNGRDDDSGWSDERIRAAYRGMVGDSRAPEVVRSVMEAVESHPRRHGPTGFRSRLRRPAGALASLAAVLVAVAVVGALLAYRGARVTGAGTPGPQASPATMSVSEALAVIGGKSVTSTDLFAVEGWLAAPEPPVSCPTLTVDGSFGVGCGAQVLSLTETADGTESRLDADVLGGTAVPDVVAGRGAQPARVVVVGHVHDSRASLCSTAARAHCEAAFVVDQVASFDGKSLGPSVAILRADSNPSPKMSADQVVSAASTALQSGSTIVSLTAATLGDAHVFSPGLAPSGPGEVVLWYVRIAGLPPLTPPMPGSHAGSGLLVLDDATGSVAGGAGWGWDPARAGLALPDGTVTLHTTNWLSSSLCAGVGLEAVLRGSRDDPRVAWLENEMVLPSNVVLGPSTFNVVWPAGYRARFAPKLEILDASGIVVLQDGSNVGGACFAGDPLYLQPPFN
jgi:hypothetical protein